MEKKICCQAGIFLETHGIGGAAVILTLPIQGDHNNVPEAYHIAGIVPITPGYSSETFCNEWCLIGKRSYTITVTSIMK